MSVSKITIKTVTLEQDDELELKHGETLLEQKIVIERVDESGLRKLFKRTTYMPVVKVVCVIKCVEYDDQKDAAA